MVKIKEVSWQITCNFKLRDTCQDVLTSQRSISIQVVCNTTIGKEKEEETLTKKFRDLLMKGTLKQTEASLKCFDDHRRLSQSERANVCKQTVKMAPPCVHIYLISSDRERYL